MSDRPRPPNEEDLRRVGSGRVAAETAARLTRGALRRLPHPAARTRWRSTAALAGASLGLGLAAGYLAFRLELALEQTSVKRLETAPSPALPVASPALAGMTITALDAPRAATVLRHQLQISPRSSVRVDQAAAGQVALRVVTGRSRFAVEPLREQESFQVRVGELLVEVVGTRFEVAKEGECGRVAVSEGRVRVAGYGVHDLVSQGEQKIFCPPPPDEPEHPPRVDPTPLGPSDEPGTELVREALVLISSGHELDKAAQLLRLYRAEHPRGVFTEDALFHLCILELRLRGAAHARALSLEFRHRFPNTTRGQTLERLLQQAP